MITNFNVIFPSTRLSKAYSTYIALNYVAIMQIKPSNENANIGGNCAAYLRHDNFVSFV